MNTDDCEATIGRGKILQKLRSVKTENNLEEMGKMLGVHGLI